MTLMSGAALDILNEKAPWDALLPTLDLVRIGDSWIAEGGFSWTLQERDGQSLLIPSGKAPHPGEECAAVFIRTHGCGDAFTAEAALRQAAQDCSSWLPSDVRQAIRELDDNSEPWPSGDPVDELTVSGAAVSERTTRVRSVGRRVALRGEQPELRLTQASQISSVAVRWTWDAMVPAGHLTLLAGREGVGKSTVALDIAARLTQGTLPGIHMRMPQAVLVMATEDDWASTVNPRLMAAGANLDLIYRVDGCGTATDAVDLPADIPAIERALVERSAAMLLLDPLMPRLNGRLDSHKDQDVRRALEPLSACLQRTGVAAVGLIHFNKSSRADPVNAVMGSRAFTAVARSVAAIAVDPGNSSIRHLGVVKSNLAATPDTTRTFALQARQVQLADGEITQVAAVTWGAPGHRSIQALLQEAAAAETGSRTHPQDNWLIEHLTASGGLDTTENIKVAGLAAGFTSSQLDRARQRLDLPFTRASQFQGGSTWSLPAAPHMAKP